MIKKNLVCMCTENVYLCSRREGGDDLCPLESWMARREKVKTSIEHQPLRCKGWKFTCPKFWGAPKGVSNETATMLEPGKNSRSVSAHLFLTRICCLILSSWRSFYTSIRRCFLPAATCYLVVNKPWCMFNRVSLLSTCYHGEVTAEGLKSL